MQSSVLPNLFQNLKPFESEDNNDHREEFLSETLDAEKQEKSEDQLEEDGVWVEVCSKITRRRRNRRGVYWNNLRRDIMVIIFSKMELIDMLTTVPLVCQLWRKISKQPGTIRRLDLRTYRGDLCAEHILNFVTKAVDRSCGELVEFTAHRCVSDEIVGYVVSNTKQLKALRFCCWSYITREGLVSAIRKAPYLEELELFGGDCNNEVAKEIVRSCPLLKCFRINSREGEIDEAMLMQGLEIVIDGCPNLECLDLEFCSVDLNEVWLMKWEERIRTLRHPKERSDDDYLNEDYFRYPCRYYDEYYFKYGLDSSYYDTSSCSSDDENNDRNICYLLPPKATAYYI